MASTIGPIAFAEPALPKTNPALSIIAVITPVAFAVALPLKVM